MHERSAWIIILAIIYERKQHFYLNVHLLGTSTNTRNVLASNIRDEVCGMCLCSVTMMMLMVCRKFLVANCGQMTQSRWRKLRGNSAG